MEYHPNEMKGITGSIDEIGVITYSIPYRANSIEEVVTVAKGREVNGLPERTRSWQPGEGAIFIVTVIYQGQQSPGDTPKASEIQTAVRPSYREEPLEAHPDIIAICDKYAGKVNPNTGQVTFPMYYIPGKDGGRGLSDGSGVQKASKRNPFFGVEKYMKLDVTFTRVYAVQGLPGDLLSRIGKVVGTPPNAPSGYGNRKKWLVMPPTSNQRGNIVEVTEEYLLLDDDIAPELYKPA